MGLKGKSKETGFELDIMGSNGPLYSSVLKPVVSSLPVSDNLSSYKK